MDLRDTRADGQSGWAPTPLILACCQKGVLSCTAGQLMDAVPCHLMRVTDERTT